MIYLVIIAIIIVSSLLLVNLYLIIKDFLDSDFPLEEKATYCINKKCAFYNVTEYQGTIKEIAKCERGIKDFDKIYRGDIACKKSIIYFGKSSSETYDLVKKRRKELFTSISSFTGYVALILSLYKSLPGS